MPNTSLHHVTQVITGVFRYVLNKSFYRFEFILYRALKGKPFYLTSYRQLNAYND